MRVHADGGAHRRRSLTPDQMIRRTSDGAVTGSWRQGGLPSGSGDRGVAETIVDSFNVLLGFGPGYDATRWRLDPHTWLTPALIAARHAYTTTLDFSDRLMALRLDDGKRDWCVALTGPQRGHVLHDPYPLAAGDGMLFVRNNYALAAFESGGRPSNCAGPGPAAPADPPAARPSPALRLTARRKSVEIGRRTRLVARLSGVARESGRRIALEVDKWPLDGRFVRARRGTTGRGGATRFAYAPRRNARLRARLLGAPTLVSEPVTIYADFARRVRKLDAGGRHPRLRVKIRAPARVLRRPVFAYLARGTEPWTRVDRGRWDRSKVTLRYPRGALADGDRWLVCTRERKPDAFGRPRPRDPLCGQQTLPRDQRCVHSLEPRRCTGGLHAGTAPPAVDRRGSLPLAGYATPGNRTPKRAQSSGRVSGRMSSA